MSTVMSLAVKLLPVKALLPLSLSVKQPRGEQETCAIGAALLGSEDTPHSRMRRSGSSRREERVKAIVAFGGQMIARVSDAEGGRGRE